MRVWRLIRVEVDGLAGRCDEAINLEAFLHPPVSNAPEVADYIEP
jgi:hypothetical protein